MSKLITSMKVVEDYSSDDDEKGAAVHKMKSNSSISHRKIQRRHKKDKVIEQRDKRRSPQQRWNRAEENSSDEINRRHDDRSRKHKVIVNSKDRTSHNRKETQPESYQDNDSSDYDRRHSNRETEKNKEKVISDDDRRYGRRHIQRTEHRYDHNSDIDRREVEGNNDWQNDDNDRIYGRRQQEKGRYWDDDSSNHHKRDRRSKHIEDPSNMKNNWRDDKTDSLRGSYQNESDHERSKRKKSRNEQNDDDYHNRRDSRHQAQNEDDSDFERSHIEETGYQSDCDDSDYDKGDGRQADRNRLDDERNYSDREKHKHKYKDKTWFSDDDDKNDRGKRKNKRDGEKSKHHQSKENESNSNGRKDERSMRKNKSHHNDSNHKSNERRQPEKTKHKQKSDHSEDITDFNKNEMQKDKHYLAESDHNRRQILKRGNKDDWDKRSHDRQKVNRKIRQQREDKNDSWSDSDRASDSIEPQQDRCRWDSNEDERDKRKIQQKYWQNSDNEDGRKENVGRHSVTDKINQKRKNNRDLREREENRNVQRKDGLKEKERASEMQFREELSRRKDDRYREHGRRERQSEPELQRTGEGSEHLRSEVQKRSRRNEEAESNLGDAKYANEEGAAKKQKTLDDILTRTGGAYIPPARLRAMQAQITDKSSVNYQRIAWEALKKSINGLINKVNVSNLKIIVNELFKENIVRAKGILSRSIMQAQAASPTFTHVYAALVAIINTKFPHIGELIIKRLIIQFRRSFRRNDKQVCFACTNFIAHLVNQQAAHEVLALEILTLLLENPTDDSVELAVGFLKECGLRLSDATRRGTDAIFERLRSILHDGEVDKRVQYMIEVMFAVRKDKFKDHPTVIEELDLVEEEDQFTHLITLEDAINPEDILNVFKYDPEFEVNEAKYEEIRKALLESSDSEDNSGDESNDNEDEENENETQTIIDNTETNLTSLRRTIYLTIQSSLDFEECAHKLLKLELKPGQIVELCYMILDCCAQQRTYEKFFGLLAQRFCHLNKIYVEPFESIFKTAYDTIHRFETNKLRNVARFFAHLFYTDAISWQILSHIKLNEDDTTSSSRIFIKILFQELCEYMGLLKLNQRVKDPTMQEAFEGLFPRDSPRNTRFAINFFTSIGLGGLTDELREHLKNAPKPAAFTSIIPSAEKDDNDENPDINNEEEASIIVENSPSSDCSSEEEEARNEKSKQSKKKRKKKSKDKKSKKRRKIKA